MVTSSVIPHTFDPFAPVPAPTPAATRKGKPVVSRTPYDLTLALPQDQITFADGPDGTRSVNLEFAFDAYDLNGKFLGSHSQSVVKTLTPAQSNTSSNRPSSSTSRSRSTPARSLSASACSTPSPTKSAPSKSPSTSPNHRRSFWDRPGLPLK